MIRPLDLDALAIELAALAMELKAQNRARPASTMLQAAGLVDRAADELAALLDARDGGEA